MTTDEAQGAAQELTELLALGEWGGGWAQHGQRFTDKQLEWLRARLAQRQAEAEGGV